MKTLYHLFATCALILTAINNAQAKALREAHLYSPRFPPLSSDNEQQRYAEQLELYKALSKIIDMVRLGSGSKDALPPSEPKSPLQTHPQLQQESSMREYLHTMPIGSSVNSAPAPMQHYYYAQQPNQYSFQDIPKVATYPAQQQPVHYQLLPQAQTYQDARGTFFQYASQDQLQQPTKVQYVLQTVQEDKKQDKPQIGQKGEIKPEQKDHEQSEEQDQVQPEQNDEDRPESGGETQSEEDSQEKPSQQVQLPPKQPVKVQLEPKNEQRPEPEGQVPSKPHGQQPPLQQNQPQTKQSVQVQSVQKGQQMLDKQGKQNKTVYGFIAMLINYLMGQ